MQQLTRCSHCQGFLALALRACPHCDAPVRRAQGLVTGLAAAACGGAVSLTLMACYGPAPRADGPRVQPAPITDMNTGGPLQEPVEGPVQLVDGGAPQPE